MGKTFRLDGKSHAVCPEDVVLMKGPGQYTANDGIIIDLQSKDTLTVTLDNLVPGQAITISCNVLPTTTFFRPDLIYFSGALVDQEAEVSVRKTEKALSPCGAK